jgi:hypothetical protein
MTTQLYRFACERAQEFAALGSGRREQPVTPTRCGNDHLLMPDNLVIAERGTR